MTRSRSLSLSRSSESDQITITVSRKAVESAIAALEDLGDTNPWTADEYDDPADELIRAVKQAKKRK